MYQIKEIEPFQHYRFFAAFGKGRPFLAVCGFILPLRHEINHFVAFSSQNLGGETKEDRFVLRLRHAVSPFLRRHLTYLFHDLARHVAKILPRNIR